MSAGGSGKKGKTQPIWFTCSKCNKRYIRSISMKHVDNNCYPIYPYIDDGLLKITIGVVSPKSATGKLHFMGTKQANWMLLMSKELIRESGLVSLCWVKLSSDSCPEGVLLRVWPLSAVGESIQTVLMTKEGMALNRLSTEENYSVEMALDFKMSLPLRQLELQIDESGDDDVVGDLEEFGTHFKRAFMGRMVSLSQKFQLKQLIFDIPVSITGLDFDGGRGLKLEESFAEMEITSKSSQAKSYGEITQQTIVIIKKERDLTLNKSNEDFRKYELKDMGGIDSVIQEISSTIRFILSNCLPGFSNISRGILIFGNFGTGKSHLMKALCTHFNLHQILFDPSDKSNQNLREIFSMAVLKSPSAILIENIDTLSSNKSQGFNFNSGFRCEMEKLLEENPSSKIIVLGSCNEIELLDSSIRSPHLFAKEVEIPVPSKLQRKGILVKLLNRQNHNLSEEDIEKISGETHGFVAADLVSLLSRSASKAFERDSISPRLSFADCEECLKFVRPSAIRSMIIDVPNVRWEDIGGQKDLKFILKQAIEWPLKHPESFLRLGITPPKGILMYGPPGCSKTMIAKAIATESGLNFLSVKGSELFSKWVGESEKAVRSIFRKARQVAPCIVFFDEIDSLGGERGTSSGSSNVHERVLAQLLIEMDGIEPLKEVTIVAATNRPDIIDQALLRPGRLDKIVYVPLPDAQTRRDIFRIRFRKMPIDPEINIEILVSKTGGYSGAEIVGVCQEAALKALEEDINSSIVKLSHFISALEIIYPRISPQQIQFYENYSKKGQK